MPWYGWCGVCVVGSLPLIFLAWGILRLAALADNQVEESLFKLREQNLHKEKENEY
jgi:hypothetical protein